VAVKIYIDMVNRSSMRLK